MQTVVQVWCTKGKSLRNKIADNRHQKDYGFVVRRQKQPNRKPGWTEIRSTREGRQGAMNWEWYPITAILTCRVVDKGGGRPNDIVGDFTAYLLKHHRKRIKLLAIVP
jgi:hypothetical protein